MNGDFSLGKPGYYNVQFSEENDFLNDKLTTKDYGIYYSVKFEGSAEAILWQTKTPPVEGDKVWGMVEQSKSGKSLRFKKLKLEDAPRPQGGYDSPEKEESIARAVALKAAVQLHVGTEFEAVLVLKDADRFLEWLKGEIKPEPDPEWANRDIPPEDL